MAHRPMPAGPLIDYSVGARSHDYRLPPDWYNCDADEFINRWLPLFESGQKRKPTKAELDSLTLASSDDDFSEQAMARNVLRMTPIKGGQR